ARVAAVLAFISFPVTALSSILFGAVMGLLWLSTVAPTNSIIALIFGTRWLATLAGLAFFSHQVGGFLGVWLGGIVFVRTGSYDAVWWLSVLFGVLSAVVNLPIVGKPVMRAAAGPAWRWMTPAGTSARYKPGTAPRRTRVCPRSRLGARPPSSWPAAA